MKTINLKKEVNGSLDDVLKQTTEALKTEGFGVLTQIDFHTKIKEKIGQIVPPTIILGACNPSLAYEAYKMNTDVTALLPCNAVLREVGPNRVSVELALPSAMMEILGDKKLVELSSSADLKLQKVLNLL